MEPAKSMLETVDLSPQASAGGSTESFMRILVGYDGRPGSRDALALAKALCESGETDLIVACVRPYWPDLVGAESFPMLVEEDERWVRRGATPALGATPFSTRVVAEGHETAGLKVLAEAEESDVIIIGSTDRGRPGHVCPGSVGERVLDRAPCAVAVAPRGLADGDASIHEIAIGYDGSQASKVALRRAIGLADRCQASLLILGAVEISLGLAGYETRQPKELQKVGMERHIQRALEAVPATIAARSELLVGAPSRALVDAASDADLLVLGSRGNYAVDQRLVLGTVGTAAMRSAACPTLVTPTAS